VLLIGWPLVETNPYNLGLSNLIGFLPWWCWA
jgi:hypothetical protein